MKKTILLLIIFLFSIAVHSQLVLTDGTDLYLESGSSLYIATDMNSNNATLWNYGIIDLKGNLVNNTSTLFNTTSTGIFIFNGLSLQEITGNHDVGFYGIMEIDNEFGLALTNTYSGAHQTINGGLIFTNGNLLLNEFNLTLGIIEPTGVMPDKYIVTNNTGMLQRLVTADGSSITHFPVGNTSYNPVILQNSLTATTDVYGVRVEDQEPAGLLSSYFIDRSWVIDEEVPGGSDLNITLYWNSGEELTDFNYSYSAVGRVNGTGPLYDWGEFGAASGEDPYYRTGDGFVEPGTYAIGNLAPVAICQDVTVSVDEYCNGYITTEQIDNGSYDPDEYSVNLSLDQYGPFSLGETIVTLSVTDPGGALDQCSSIVTVIDDTPPLINTIANPITLWPPNLQYELFNLSDFVLSVSDNCSNMNIVDVFIVSATSDEPDAGGAYGNIPNDIIIAENCKSIQLRRERFGGGNGRVYTVFLELEDDYGNMGMASCQLYVPKNINSIGIDDGPDHEVFGDCYNKSVLFTDNSSNGNLLVYPNPFKESITIEYELINTGNINIRIFNQFGSQVEIIDQANYQASKQKYVWNTMGLPSGLYFVQVRSKQEVAIQKIIKMR